LRLRQFDQQLADSLSVVLIFSGIGFLRTPVANEAYGFGVSYAFF